MAIPRLPTKTKTQALLPSAAVQGAYDLKLTPEAAERLKEIKDYGDYAAQQTTLASKVSIKDDASDAQGAELLVNLTKARKGLEDLQKFFTSPLEQRKKLVIAVFKKLLEGPEGQEERLRREREGYFEKKENARREEAARRDAQAETDRRKAAALGRSAPKLVEAPPLPETQRSVATENGTAGITMVWGYDVVDESLVTVPQQYITRSLNKKAVDAAIEAGVRVIPGLRISERPRSVVR